MGLSKSQSKVAKSQPAKKPEVATPKKGAATKKESATPKREVAAPKKAKKAEKPSVPKGPHWENDVWLGNQGKKWTADQEAKVWIARKRQGEWAVSYKEIQKVLHRSDQALRLKVHNLDKVVRPALVERCESLEAAGTVFGWEEAALEAAGEADTASGVGDAAVREGQQTESFAADVAGLHALLRACDQKGELAEETAPEVSMAPVRRDSARDVMSISSVLN